MAEKGITQRVAAILAADAVGYTRLMAGDEPANRLDRRVISWATDSSGGRKPNRKGLFYGP